MASRPMESVGRYSVEVGDQHADQPRAPALEASGELIGLVPQVACRLGDALLKLAEALAFTAEIARDAGLGGTCGARDIENGAAQ